MLTRRAFLGRTAVGLFGLSLVRCAMHEVQPLTAGVAVPFLTPVGEHYVKNGAEGSVAGWKMPSLAPEAWSLAIDGLVEAPLTLGLADLEAMPAIEVVKTMQCVVDSNSAQGLVGTALWRGVPLRPLLERAGVDRGRARRLHLFGADGFRNNLPLDRVFAVEAGIVEPLLVTHMNGAPLLRRHGAPVRLLVHDGYGFANVKWLERIEATDDDRPFGTYQDTGFTDELRSPVSSRFTAPTDNLTVAAGTVVCHGFAMSGGAGIERVELRIDGGPWQEATLVSPDDVLASDSALAGAAQFNDPARFEWPFRAVWVLWSFAWEATPGRHEIEVRATDREGARQPDRDRDISDGTNAVAAIRVEVTA